MKLIIFDFDGTLGDTRGNIVTTMRQTLKQLGYPEASEDAIARLRSAAERKLPDAARFIAERIAEDL